MAKIGRAEHKGSLHKKRGWHDNNKAHICSKFSPEASRSVYVPIWVELEQYLALCTVSFRHYFLRFQNFQYYVLMFRHHEKTTKFWKIFHLVWKLLSNVKQSGRFFSNLCGLLRIFELYLYYGSQDFEGKTQKKTIAFTLNDLYNQKITLLFFC